MPCFMNALRKKNIFIILQATKGINVFENCTIYFKRIFLHYGPECKPNLQFEIFIITWCRKLLKHVKGNHRETCLAYL